MLSKKALEKLYNFIGNETKCRQDEDGNEDLEMGRYIRLRSAYANLFESTNPTIYIESFQVDVLLKTHYLSAIKTA